MSAKSRRLVFGPVPSRRLGRSLGVDLVPFKTCSYDCIYCQLGRTTRKTVVRQEWVPLKQVLQELKPVLVSRPDYITLSGSGEPTLCARLGELIDAIHDLTDIPVAVLTNGSLLWDKTVRTQLRRADVVLPSLDAADAVCFRTVNRPHSAITFDMMLHGLIDFRQEYEGQYWLEVFLLGGYTALPPDVRKLAACVKRIQPDRVQLNTVTRPPAEEYAVSVARARLQEFATLFEPKAEVIADYRRKADAFTPQADRVRVLDLLRRRPCTLGDVAKGLGLHAHEAAKALAELETKELVVQTRFNRRSYWRAVSHRPATPRS